MDLSQLISPARNSGRQNNTAGTPNSRPNSILLETLVEDDSSSPSPSPRIKIPSLNFDFKPVDIPKFNLSDDDDDEEDDDNGQRRDRRTGSELSYESLPTPTPFDDLENHTARQDFPVASTTPSALYEDSSASTVSAEVAGRESGTTTPTPDVADANDGQNVDNLLAENGLERTATAELERSERGDSSADISSNLHMNSVDDVKETRYDSSTESASRPNLTGSRGELSSCGSQEDLDDGQEWNEDDISPDLKLGTLVCIGDTKTGFIRFIGRTDFAPGPWIGVELDIPKGKFKGPCKRTQQVPTTPNIVVCCWPTTLRPFAWAKV